MPSHIYYRVGRYADAVRVNELAAKVDEAYIAACKAQGYYPAGYYGHNIHFLWTSSEMQGRYQAAIDAARRLVKAVDAYDLAKSLPSAEFYGFTPVATLLRFGQWDAMSWPSRRRRTALVLDTAVWLYARGFAHANQGRPAAARRPTATGWRRLIAAPTSAATTPRPFRPGRWSSCALELLDGEIARTSGDLDGAVDATSAPPAAIEPGLPYTEPP